MLIFFAGTGALQMFGFRLGILSEVHTRGYGSLPFMLLAFFMGLSVIITSLLGAAMAFRSGEDRKATWACLLFGILVPLVMLLIVHFKS